MKLNRVPTSVRVGAWGPDKLEARGEAKTGAKAWLRRRLHAAILRVHLESAAEDQ